MMSHYFEIWLRDTAKNQLRELSNRDRESYHPHVTIARPFEIIGNEYETGCNVVDFCSRIRKPIPFYLEGVADFDGKFYHVPVFEDGRLMRFNDGFENLISGDVDFVKKIDSVKNFHATVDVNEEGFCCPRIDQHMLRLTGIRDEKIWFSYDFVTGNVLDRKESSDKERWNETVAKFKDDMK